MIIHRHALPLLPPGELFTLPIHDDADIVHVGVKSDGTAHVWEVHDETRTRPAVVPERSFRVVATGQPWTGIHHGTWIEGTYVWHLIELPEDAA